MKRYTATLILCGPVHSASTAMAAFGIDTPIARHPDGRPYLAGSHVWGKVRDALVNLKQACEEIGDKTADHWKLERWCGGLREREGGSGDGGDETAGHNARRLIHFHDFDLVCAGNSAKDYRQNSPERTRIAIDAGTGAALDGALQVLEQPWYAGEEAIFKGAFTLIMPDTDAAIARKAIEAALNWIFQFGGMRTIGFGQVLATKVEENGELYRSLSAIDTGTTDALKISLSFDEPFLIASIRETQNTYVSSDVIPGGVVKGALANMLAAQDEKLPRNFDDLIITHLFPTKAGNTRPVAIPHSFVAAEGEIYDVALTEDDTILLGGKACAFSPDWKDEWDKAREIVNWPKKKTLLRLRTAIDRDARAAETKKLFGYEMCRTDEHDWTGEIRLDNVPAGNRKKLVDELQKAFANGLPGIGRTQAFAHVSLYDAEPPETPQIKDDPYIVTLQTPALICDPNENYKDAFDKLSGGVLTCERWFVRERLAGASFMAARFFTGRNYRPFLLSEAGCVFVLKPAGDKKTEAEALIRYWAKTGLPVGEHLKIVYDFSSLDNSKLWRQCPYIPQNGYGEIAVNQGLHRNLNINGGRT